MVRATSPTVDEARIYTSASEHDVAIPALVSCSRISPVGPNRRDIARIRTVVIALSDGKDFDRKGAIAAGSIATVAGVVIVERGREYSR